MELATVTPITETATLATTPGHMHPAAVTLCEVLDAVAVEGLHGDHRQALATFAAGFAAYLRTPD